tara:strand:+ start:2715 stop:3296 length:582 start_codon:yes stop_codon:yes gene_type:complete
MKILFCIPGDSFSARFLTNWTALCVHLTNNKIQYYLSTGYAPIITIARETVLQAINEIDDLTHVMWIDSDIDFTSNDFFKLLKQDKPVVSGIYRLGNGEDRYSAWIDGKWLDKKGIEQNKNCCSSPLLDAEYVGLGWMLTKTEIYNNIPKPYFSINSEQMEDEMFCRKLKKVGYKINVDTTALVGHEKVRVLR